MNGVAQNSFPIHCAATAVACVSPPPTVKILLALMLLVTMVPGVSNAAEPAVGGWVAGFVAGKFNDEAASRWYYKADAQSRFFDVGSGLHEHLIRPGVGYAVNDSVKVWVGYARFLTKSRSTGRLWDENRYWQQVDWSGGVLDGALTLRAMTEQRDVNYAPDVRHVLRLLARYQRPIGGDTMLSDWFVSVEPFLDINDTTWGGGTGISQNRAFLGLGMKLRPGLRMEAGLMQQYFWVDDAEDRAHYLGVFNFKWSF